MSRLDDRTRALRDSRRKALVAFLTAGYPDAETFVELVKAAADAGADVIEIGIPFSDPIADGPVIQAASAIALAGGMTLARSLDAVERLAGETDAAFVIMGYVNPVLGMGVEAFATRAAAAGANGVILPDVSFEESAAFRNPVRDAGLCYVDLIAPTSGDDRISMIASRAEGFIYLVSMTGVTGARGAAADDLVELTNRVRAASKTPVYVGFGISSPEQASAASATADGVIIGSQLLRLAGAGAPREAAGRVGDFLAGVRRALDRTGN
jgi:tryptophan synthase alpha chain